MFPQGPRKGVLHPRNKHQGHYDFKVLQSVYPKLKEYTAKNPSGVDTVDFANPEAVKALNCALLKQYYGIDGWNIPEGYLCPPIPGRADYIHHAADLLASCNRDVIPRGSHIRVLDVGVGANCIYPIIGNGEYGWSFVGSDIDKTALKSAQAIVDANAKLKSAVELRLQTNSPNIFRGIIQGNEKFDFMMSNPPFHASQEEANYVNTRKWRNLGKAAVANFGGQNNELWCEGGEVAFVTQVIEESTEFQKNCMWFSAFLSKVTSLEPVFEALEGYGARECHEFEMAQGQKRSRFVAWTFLNEAEQAGWASQRLKNKAQIVLK